MLTGGGGYASFSVVPRVWAGAMAVLLASEVPTELPAEWIASAQEAAASYGLALRVPSDTFDQGEDLGANDGKDGPPTHHSSETALVITQSVINRVRHVSPLLGGGR